MDYAGFATDLILLTKLMQLMPERVKTEINVQFVLPV